MDRPGRPAVTLLDGVKMLSDHQHKPVKSGAFFLKVGHSQQNANQAGKVLDGIEVVTHSRKRILHVPDKLLCRIHRGTDTETATSIVPRRMAKTISLVS
jgi:hypothetical protein